MHSEIDVWETMFQIQVLTHMISFLWSIYEIIDICTAVVYEVKSDQGSKFSNLSNWKWEAWKNQSFNVWLHSLVGRASHRYRGGHEFESRWSPDFFRLLISNCLNWKIYWDDHSLLHIQPQYKYELFHIDFTITNISWHSPAFEFSLPCGMNPAERK